MSTALSLLRLIDYGLRDYGTAEWVGGDAECDHKVGRFEYPVSGKQASNNGSAGHQAREVCPKCGAIRVDNQIGLEQSPDDYVAAMVAVFREVWRVLREDGVVFLNLGDSYSNGIGSNVTDCLESLIKGGVLFIGGSNSLTITTQRENVLGSNGGSPDGKFLSLFGLERIFIKQRDNDFGKVIYLFNPEIECRLGKSLAISRPNDTSIEIILDESDDLSVIIPECHLNKQPSFGIAVGSFTAKDTDMTFAVKKSAKPVTESIGNIESVGDAAQHILTIKTMQKKTRVGNGRTTVASG